MAAKEHPPKNLAIVGRNIYGALAANAAVQKPDYRVSWHQHESDIGARTKQNWVFIPDRRKLSVPLPEVFFVRPNLISVYYTTNKRVPLDAFVTYGVPRWNHPANHPHPAIRKKIYAMGVWNDLTPLIWEKEGVPNVNWPKNDPDAMAVTQWAGPALVPKEASLQALEETFKGEGVEVFAKAKAVTHIEKGRFGGNQILQHNAPHGITEADNILWVTPHSPKAGPRPKGLAQWKTYFCEVDRRLISPLPLVSFWLDPSPDVEFFETGLVTSKCLKRVFVIPRPGQESDILQIQFFHLEADRKKKTKESAGRIDEFLWDLCPYLASAKLDFNEVWSDEDVFLESAKPIRSKICPRAQFFWQGGMGEAIEERDSFVI